MTGRRGGRDLFPEAGKGLDAALESFSRTRERPGGAERGGSSPAQGGSPGLRVVEGGGTGGARPVGSAASQVVTDADKDRRRRRSGGARPAVQRPSIKPEWLTDAVAGRLAVPGLAEARTDEEIVAACAAAARGLAASAVREGV